MPSRCPVLPVLLLLPAALPAQRPPAATGSITGYITLPSSNLPARNARVTLEPVPQLGTKPPDSGGSLGVEGNHTIVETLPDGSFRFPAVSPGNYYVIADKLGFVSPIGALTRADLEHPTDQSLARMAKLLTGVTVVANKNSEVKVQLHLGAVVAGTVRFDDGSPDTGARVQLKTRDDKGKWTLYRTTALGSFFGDVHTDDRGQYRITGLPAGQYVLLSTLGISEMQTNFVFGGQGGSSSRPIFSLDIYQGQTFRPADAKPINLTEAEDAEGNDVEIPVAKLHSLTGSLAEQRTGHQINAGRVALVFPGSEDILATTGVASEDGQFHFAFVPEGTYTLRVTNARDVVREEISNGKGAMPPTRTRERVTATYADAAQPIVFNGDQTGLVVSVLPAPAGPAPPAPALVPSP